MANRKTKSEWMEIVKEFKASGLGITAWCKQHGICKTTIYPYIRMFNNENHVENQEWAKLSIPKKPFDSPITIKGSSITLDVKNGFDKETLSEVLIVVMSLC